MGGGATRERGRPARMLSRWCRSVSLRCGYPATLNGGNGMGLGRSRVLASLPVEPGGGGGLRLCQELCGRDQPDAPGWSFIP